MAAERGVGISARIGPTAFNEINGDIAADKVALQVITEGVVAKISRSSNNSDGVRRCPNAGQCEFGRFCSSFDDRGAVELEWLAVGAETFARRENYVDVAAIICATEASQVDELAASRNAIAGGAALIDQRPRTRDEGVAQCCRI